MADYYTLLTKAVSALDTSDAQSRRAIYERARHALLKQLRSVEPALPESDITRERLALEEAVRRVELAMTQKPAPASVIEKPVIEKPVIEKQIIEKPAPIIEAPALEKPVLAKPVLVNPALVKPALQTIAVPNDVTAIIDETPAVVEKQLVNPQQEVVAPLPPLPRANLPKPPVKPANLSVEPEKQDVSFEQKGKVHFDHLPEAKSNKGKLAIYLVIGVLLGLALLGALWFMFMSPSETPPVQRTQVQPAQVAQPVAPPSDKKNDQRIDQDRPVRAPIAPVNKVAQPPKAILYEETPGAAQQGNFLQGSVKWRNENYQDNGQQPDIAIVGEVLVPDRQLKFIIKIKRNQDKSLTASHLVEINTVSTGTIKIAAMPGFLMKVGEQTRGQPISAQAAKIIDGFFLIGLSAITADITRNVELMKDWAYLDFPIEFDNRRRAVLTLEKGAEGDKAFAEAFANWGQ